MSIKETSHFLREVRARVTALAQSLLKDRGGCKVFLCGASLDETALQLWQLLFGIASRQCHSAGAGCSVKQIMPRHHSLLAPRRAQLQHCAQHGFEGPDAWSVCTSNSRVDCVSIDLPHPLPCLCLAVLAVTSSCSFEVCDLEESWPEAARDARAE